MNPESIYVLERTRDSPVKLTCKGAGSLYLGIAVLVFAQLR